MQVVQYSPNPEIADMFRKHPFAYCLEGHSGLVITTMNRIRIFLASVFGLEDVSRNIILALLNEMSGEVIGEAVDTYGNISQICFLHVWGFQRRVEIALRRGEIC